MSNILIDDEFKSDKYSVSLNELLFGRPYKPNVVSVSKLLDDNGYFGRYRIEVVKDRKFGTDILIRIHVYLVDSGVNYVWPYNTFFDLDTKRFGHNRKVPRGVFSNKSMFTYCFSVLATMFTPRTKLHVPSSLYEIKCITCMAIIKDGNHPINEWAWIISKNHGNFAHRIYYEKIIPFLSRIGIISNNKFKIIGEDDPTEYTSNLFDIDYWHNI
jgi:hypothetical protein